MEFSLPCLYKRENIPLSSVLYVLDLTTAFNVWKHLSSALKAFLKVLNPTGIIKIIEKQ